MSELLELDVSHRKLEELDCADHPQLKLINASYNKLASTDGLVQCFLLTHLNLSHNYLTRLEGWYCFEHLAVLDLSHNQLVSTYGLRNCFKLKHVLLQHNMLKNLEGLEAMLELETLNISHNWLSEVASSIRLLSPNKNLHTLWMEGNPLEGYKQACWSLLDSLTILDDEFTPPSSFRSRQPGRNSYSINMSRGKRGQNLYHKYEHSLSVQEQIFVNRLKQPKTRPSTDTSRSSSRREKGKVGVSLLSIKSPPVVSPSAHMDSRDAGEMDLEKFLQTPLDVLMRKDVHQHPLFSIPPLAPMSAPHLSTSDHESPKSVHFSPRVEQFTVDSYDPFESVQTHRSDVKGVSDEGRASDSHRSAVDEALKSASLSEEDIEEYLTLLMEKQRILQSLKKKGEAGS